MEYFYALYAFAVVAALALIIATEYRAHHRRRVIANKKPVAIDTRDSRRRSSALTRWVAESAAAPRIVPVPEPAAAPRIVPVPEPAAEPAPDVDSAPSTASRPLYLPAKEEDCEAAPILTTTSFDPPASIASASSGETTGASGPADSVAALEESEQSVYPEYNWNEAFGPTAAPETNYYEVLQISPNADMETIHRVYRILAARFHPDNPRTGNVERFYLLSKAFEVLSNTTSRRAYDACYRTIESEPKTIFRVEDFIDGVKGEENRRLGVLSLLYNRRRFHEDHPGLSVLDLEQRMAIPREYLHFTIWYLRAKKYIQTLDNSDCSLTPEGVDYVEEHSSSNHVIRELLTAGHDDTLAEDRTERIRAA